MGKLYDATWGRGFSALYPRMIKSSEEGGFREMRREALSGATGRTIDLGAGAGANVGLFPDAVTELVLAEPDPYMLRQLRANAPPDVEIVDAPAEALPFEDSTFDTAVFTLVLCTVPDPAAALAEAARVLKPGGRLLFVEHVRSEEEALARWQDRLERLWRFAIDGCHCNLDTVSIIDASPFTVEGIEKATMPKSPPLIKPLVVGSAVVAP